MQKSEDSKVNLNEAILEAEKRLRAGLAEMGDWSEQLRTLVRERPWVLWASIGVSGFLSGLSFRPGGELGVRGGARLRPEPLFVFLGAAALGFTGGDRLIDFLRRAGSAQAPSRRSPVAL